MASTQAIAGAANNPGFDRPGFGFTPAVLQSGDVILEQGLPDFSRADGVTLYHADTLLRLGVGHALELQLGSGWNRLLGAGAAASGRVDTSLAVKFAPAETGAFSWGLLGGVEFSDGAAAFRVGHPQYTLGASLNWQLGHDHALGLYAQAAHGDGDSRLLAVNDGWSWSPTFGTYVELVVQHLAGTGNGSMGGAGLTWMATPRVQLDLGLRHRLGGNADTWQGGCGISVYFGG